MSVPRASPAPLPDRHPGRRRGSPRSGRRVRSG